MIFPVLKNRLGLKTGEGTPSLRVFLLFFLVSLGNGVGLSTSESLFIRNWGIEKLPPAFLAAALTVLISGLLLSRLGAGLPLATFFTRVYGVAVGWIFLLGAALVFFDMPRVGSGLLFITAYACLVILKNLLLQVSEAVFDLRQMKRLFALVSSGAVLGMAVGGFGIGPVLKLIHDSRALVFLWGGALLGALALFEVVRRRDMAQGPKISSGAPPAGGLGQTLGAVGKTPVLLILALLSFGTAFTVVHFDFIYMFAVRKTWADPEDVTRVFGLVRGAGTLATFLVQVLISGFLIRKLGLAWVLLIFPVTFMGFTGLILGRFGMANIMGGRLAYYLTKEAFFFPALQPVFNALAEPVRRGAVFLVYTVAGALGTLAGGLFLMGLVSTAVITPKASAWVSLSILAALVVAVLILKRAYVAELLKNLQEPSPRQLDRLEDLRELGGKDASRLLTGLLKSGDGETVRFAMEFLSKQATPDLDRAIEDVALAQEDPRVLQTAFRYFGTRSAPRLLEHHRGFLTGSSSLAYLDWVGRLEPSEATNVILREAIKSPDRKLSALGRLHRFRVAPTAEDQNALADEMNGASPDMRVFLLERIEKVETNWVAVLNTHLAADLGHKEWGPQILRCLLERGHPEINRAILNWTQANPLSRHLLQRAVGAVRRAEGAEALVADFAGEPDLVVPLANMPPSARDLFRQISLDRNLPPAVRLKACTRIREYPDPAEIPHQALWAEGARHALEGALGDGYAREICRPVDGKAQGILGDELERMKREKLHLALSLIDAGWGPAGLASALTGLESPQKEVRAAALETLENSLPKTLRDPLLLLMEGTPPQWRPYLQNPEGRPEMEGVLQRLSRGGTAWRSALAAHLCLRFKLRGAQAAGPGRGHPVVEEAWASLSKAGLADTTLT